MGRSRRPHCRATEAAVPHKGGRMVGYTDRIADALTWRCRSCTHAT